MALIQTKMISKHITANEATFSQKAKDERIANDPNKYQLEAMQLVAEKVFEPLREWYNKPITINSFYRSTAVNRLVGGAASSQHVKGEAIDLTGGNKTENKKLFEWIKANLEYDQLINEYDFTWVHVSYTNVRKNRKEIKIIG